MGMENINQLLHVIRFIVGWPMTTIGVTLSLWSRYLDYEDTIALGIKPDIWLLIGLGVFFLSVILMLAKFQRQLSKRSNGISVEKETKSEKDGVSISNSYSTGNVTAGKGSSNVGGLIGGINTGQSVTDYEQRYADWMATAIQDDVGDLSSCIIVDKPHISWEHLEERGDAYIEFNFNIWSSSVHLLEINKTVEGNIWFQDGELERTPVITQKVSQLGHLRRSRSAQFTVRQWLSFTVKVDMKTKYNTPVEFGFGGVNIPVTATLPDGSQGHTFRLPIPGKVCTTMPKHPNAPV